MNLFKRCGISLQEGDNGPNSNVGGPMGPGGPPKVPNGPMRPGGPKGSIMGGPFGPGNDMGPGPNMNMGPNGPMNGVIVTKYDQLSFYVANSSVNERINHFHFISSPGFNYEEMFKNL